MKVTCVPPTGLAAGSEALCVSVLYKPFGAFYCIRVSEI
jgi:hypothetical protein